MNMEAKIVCKFCENADATIGLNDTPQYCLQCWQFGNQMLDEIIGEEDDFENTIVV